MLTKCWHPDMAAASYKVVLLGEGKYKYDDITILDISPVQVVLERIGFQKTSVHANILIFQYSIFQYSWQQSP